MLTNAQKKKMREERSANIVGPKTLAEWNKKMLKQPFTKKLYFEVDVVPGSRVHFPCVVSSRKGKKEIRFDMGYAGLTLSDDGKTFLNGMIM